MQFSEAWLRTMANPNLSSDELAHVLTMSGLEVEEVDPVAPPFTKVIVAQVLQVERHPNADRLSVCQVDIGNGAPLSIVCGAPNVRPGMKVVCALVGAELPAASGEKPFVIKLGKLRGVESQGMLCSAKELHISEEGEGLLELPEDALIGQDIRAHYDLDDRIFTVKLTPNKADCLSVWGVAREVSALTGAPLQEATPESVPVTIAEILPVTVEAPDLCGRFSGRVIRNLNAKAATPTWMKQRLERSGLRSISALVDISNYVMLERGRPSHVFDLEKIEGPLQVRWGRKGESLELLNGNTVEVDDWVGVIADANGLESLAGIMGGEASGVSLDTTAIYLEAAFWWPEAIQGRARRYHFSTDAAHRFERGVDYATTVEDLERITALVLEICGTADTQVGPVDDHVVNLPQRQPVSVRTARACKVIGVDLSDAQIADIFHRLKLEFVQEPGLFQVTPPSYRFDIAIEEDLIEEIARIYGFENIPAIAPVAANEIRVDPENTRSLFTLRRQLADLEYQEVINFSFVEEKWEHDFAANVTPIRVLNPIASQMSVMRSSLLGGLVANVRYNLNRKASRVRLFEIGGVFLRDPQIQEGPLSVAGYDQPKRIAAIACGPEAEEQWGQPTREVDFFDLKADLEALFAPESVQLCKAAHPGLHPGRSATVIVGDAAVGYIGELHPGLLKKYDLPYAPVVFEVDASILQQRAMPAYQEIPRFPGVVRDLAVVIKKMIPAQELLNAFQAEKLRNPVCNIVQAFVLFDEYRGKGLEEDEKSLAFRFTLQDTQATLQDETVERAMQAMLAAAERECGARLR